MCPHGPSVRRGKEGYYRAVRIGTSVKRKAKVARFLKTHRHCGFLEQL